MQNQKSFEERAARKSRIRKLITELLETIGENPDRDGLKETPDRVARFWEEFIFYDPGKVDTAFENGVSNGGQMVVLGPMRVWSLCEHHLLPFYTDVTIAYIPGNVILGLSKFARIAHKHAHRLNVQERMVENIADEIIELTGTQDVAVIGYGEHLCMTMRGIKTPSKTVSSVVHGGFREVAAMRKEFFDIAGRLQ